MKSTRIPGTDLHASPICLGTGEIGTKLKGPRAFALLDTYVELGGNFVDTAQVLWNAAPLAKYPYGDPGVGFMDAERHRFHLETGMAAIPFQAQAYGLFNRMHAGTLEKMNPGFRSFYRAQESEAR